jgi:hypothetical protein
MSKGLWGADTTDERKPTWPWVSEYIGYANCFATGGGWTVRWPWGDEVIVALSNLTTKLGTANLLSSAVISATNNGDATSGWLANATSQQLLIYVSFNEAVHVTGTPTLDLISTTGVANGGTPANITLSYNSASSNLSAGKIAFGNDSFSLASAGYGDDTLVANSSSVVASWDTIHDAESGVAIANGVPAAVSLTIPVYQDKPTHVATLRVGTAQDTTNQQIGFALDFSQEVVVTGAPYIIAIGPNTDIANTKLTYNAAASNTSLGNLVFQSALTDFSTLTGNCQFTLTTNGASTNSSDGWGGIAGPAPVSKVVTHGVIVGNTFTVVQNEPFLSGNTLRTGANATNSTAQTVSFTIRFDRSVLVNTSIAVPTIRAISNHASFSNVTLAYASGTGSGNLVFSNTGLDLSTAANGAYHVNSTSVITGWNAISNTGVASELTGVATGIVANVVYLITA